MEMSPNDSTVIAITTVAIFVVMSLLIKAIVREIRWSWIGGLMMVGVSMGLVQAFGAPLTKPALHAESEKAVLVPRREVKEWHLDKPYGGSEK